MRTLKIGALLATLLLAAGAADAGSDRRDHRRYGDDDRRGQHSEGDHRGDRDGRHGDRYHDDDRDHRYATYDHEDRKYSKKQYRRHAYGKPYGYYGQSYRHRAAPVRHSYRRYPAAYPVVTGAIRYGIVLPVPGYGYR